MSRTPFVRYEQFDRVAVLTIDRADARNAVSTLDDCADFAAAIERADRNAQISALVLTGAGPAFSSGGDLKTMADKTGIGARPSVADTRVVYEQGVRAMIEALFKCEIVTIAAINGPAIGLGLGLAAACDMRVCAQTAKLASSFVKMGIVPGDGDAWTLQQAIGYPRAAELMLTGDPISADEALALGLVNKVVAADKLMQEALALAERVAVNPPRAVRLTKRLLREAQHARLADVLTISAAYQAIAHETADHKEALAAFIEKRKPNFTGA